MAAGYLPHVPWRRGSVFCSLEMKNRESTFQGTSSPLEVQRPLKNRLSPKTIVLVGNFNHPKLGTIILIVLDFQGPSGWVEEGLHF